MIYKTINGGGKKLIHEKSLKTAKKLTKVRTLDQLKK